MNPFEMVVIIVAIVSIAGILKAKYGVRRDRHGNEYHVNDQESARLRDEVKMLRDRVAVLERIATDKESSLEREIEKLRDQR
ncbi:hypothetical protein [Allosphingosinicella vermicomposti]|uniref:hypothetical protein n=1 Tax=Allosphingosinicella vermicomposti TaxID=614671 RepID=UPI000D10A0B3|nr:hypothetical protein [Allosphingosinicella vermicomposti]